MNRKAIVLSTINRIAREPFKYGAIDCCLVASEVAKDLFGIDYGARFDYSGEDAANDIIEKAGGTLTDLFSGLLGEPVTEGFEYGDPVLVKFGEVEIIGIWFGQGAYVKAKRGMFLVRLNWIIRGWRLWGE